MAKRKINKMTNPSSITSSIVKQADQLVDEGLPVSEVVPVENNSKVKPKVSVHPVWAELKDREIPAYGLPNQKVSDHAAFKSSAGNKIIITLKSTAILPLLEETFVRTHTFEQSAEYVVVSKI